MGYTDLTDDIHEYLFDVLDQDNSNIIGFDEFYSFWVDNEKLKFLNFYEKNPKWAN
jgi:hypothetical protein